MTNKKISWHKTVEWLKGHKKYAQLVRDCYFDDPLIESAQRFHRSPEWNEVQKVLSGYFNEAGNALDIGAGRGIASYALAKDGWKVTSIEPDPSVIVGRGAIKKLGLPIKCVDAYGEKMPFMNDTFDLVYVREVLHHAKNIKKFCMEVNRVLKPKGVFLATREHVINNSRDLSIFFNSHATHNKCGGEYAYTEKFYKDVLKQSGFRKCTVWRNYDSLINIFPKDYSDIKELVFNKLHLNIPLILIPTLSKFLSYIDRTPGRLYSFLCEK